MQESEIKQEHNSKTSRLQPTCNMPPGSIAGTLLFLRMIEGTLSDIFPNPIGSW